MGLLDNTTQQAYYQGNDFGNYQFVSLQDIINQFIVAYVGEDKIIPKVRRTDVAFHAQRALAELSFDTFKSCKAQEITVPASLKMTLPQDYVNYTKISWVDSAGIKHLLYPTSKTSNPKIIPFSTNENYSYEVVAELTSGSPNIQITGSELWIEHGTKVSGPIIDNFSSNCIITGSSIVGNDTIFIIQDGGGATFIPTATASDQLTFSSTDGSIYTEYLNGAQVTNTGPWTVGDNVIPVASTSDLNGIEVGMFVNEGPLNWTPDTRVVAINGTDILVDKTAIVSNPTSTATVKFISKPEKVDESSITWSNYKSSTPSENQDDYQDDTYWPMDGSRFGLDPQHAQANGSFYIDCHSGKIHFSSNISGKTVILDYISDSLGTDGEMQVHKFAEEAMYKWIAHAILAGRANVPEYQVNRFKKERFAAIRTAKLRLSNLKIEELTQILRGKSKQIKH